MWRLCLTGGLAARCRYLKSVFPEADEALLLDVLTNCDNSVQKAGVRLTSE